MRWKEESSVKSVGVLDLADGERGSRGKIVEMIGNPKKLEYTKIPQHPYEITHHSKMNTQQGMTRHYHI
jgi:hypothetical protein